MEDQLANNSFDNAQRVNAETSNEGLTDQYQYLFPQGTLPRLRHPNPLTTADAQPNQPKPDNSPFSVISPAAVESRPNLNPGVKDNSPVSPNPGDSKVAGQTSFDQPRYIAPPANKDINSASNSNEQWNTEKQAARDAVSTHKASATEDILLAGVTNKLTAGVASFVINPWNLSSEIKGIPGGTWRFGKNLAGLYALDGVYNAFLKPGSSDKQSNDSNHVNYGTALASTIMLGSNMGWKGKTAGVLGTLWLSDMAKEHIVPKSWDSSLQPNKGEAIAVGGMMALTSGMNWKLRTAYVLGSAVIGQIGGYLFDSIWDGTKAHDKAEATINQDNKTRTAESMNNAIDTYKNFATGNDGGLTSLFHERISIDAKIKQKGPTVEDMRRMATLLTVEGEVNLDKGTQAGATGKDYILKGTTYGLGGLSLDLLYHAQSTLDWVKEHGDDVSSVRDRVDKNINQITGEHNISEIYEQIKRSGNPATVAQQRDYVVSQLIQPGINNGESGKLAGGKVELAKYWRDRALVDMAAIDVNLKSDKAKYEFASVREALDKAKNLDQNHADYKQLEEIYRQVQTDLNKAQS